MVVLKGDKQILSVGHQQSFLRLKWM